MGTGEHKIGDLVYCYENGFGWVGDFNEPTSNLLQRYRNIIYWFGPSQPNIGFSDDEVYGFKENLREKLYADT